jgi:S-adenosylmethionine-diacylglycerol 3-amino-3-carboxypropyl transferase
MRAICRLSLPDARDGPLMFAQVREDPRIELQALAQSLGGSIVVVSSGGCTALSLVGAGAHRVTAVDVSRTQNHLVELKCATVRMLAASVATSFLGGQPMPGLRRRRLYELLAPLLSEPARAYWDRNPNAIDAGVLRAGRSERFIGLVAKAVERLVVRSGGIRAMLEAESVARQREIFERYWAGWRWRLLFALLLNRWSMSRAYDSSFFAHTETRSFAQHFRRLVEHALVEIPARSNYFLHEMVTGRYPVEEDDGVPPYLTRSAVARAADAADRLTLVDGSMTAYLRDCADRSIDGFALSNICEWLDARAIDALFAEIARTATIGARVVFRNFVGWTEIPEQWRSIIVERRGYGERLIQRDRSLVQHRVVVCDVREKAA